jgi:uncharacterized protein YqhQ
MTRELTPEEQQELEKLQKVIEQAVADGVLTRAECNEITAVMKADGKLTFEEFEMVRRLVCEKVASGELEAEC